MGCGLFKGSQRQIKSLSKVSVASDNPSHQHFRVEPQTPQIPQISKTDQTPLLSQVTNRTNTEQVISERSDMSILSDLPESILNLLNATGLPSYSDIQIPAETSNNSKPRIGKAYLGGQGRSQLNVIATGKLYKASVPCSIRIVHILRNKLMPCKLARQYGIEKVDFEDGCIVLFAQDVNKLICASVSLERVVAAIIIALNEANLRP